MQKGMSIGELLTKVKYDQEHKRDYVVPHNRIEFGTVGDDKTERLVTRFYADDSWEELYPNDHAITQMATHYGVPTLYARKCAAEWPRGLAEQYVHWNEEQIIKGSEPRLIRSYTDNLEVRAFLSNRFKMIDHSDVIFHVGESIQSYDLTVASSNVSERYLDVCFKSERLVREVRKGEPVAWGLRFRNSEIGLGTLSIDAILWNLICLNGAVAQKGIAKRHVGARLTSGEDAIALKADTHDAVHRVLRLEMRDMVEYLLSDACFDAYFQKAQASCNSAPVMKPQEVVQTLAKRFLFTESEQEAALASLYQAAGRTQWDVANAVTSLAHHGEYDRGQELMAIGGQIVDLPQSEWNRIVGA